MFIELTRETVLRPRQFLARLIAMKLEPAVRWQIFAAVVVLSTIGAHVFLMALDREGSLAAVTPTPLTTGIVQALLLLGGAFATCVIGRGFGGKGDFGDSLLAVSLAQGVMVAFQLLQIVVLMISVPLAEIVGFVSIGLFFWILANFIMEVHGFRSLPKVALGMFVTIFALAMVFGLLLAMVGLQPPGV